jgi:hypothetical protein
MLLLRHHRGLGGRDHIEDACSGIHRGFTAVSSLRRGDLRYYEGFDMAGHGRSQLVIATGQAEP